MAEDGYQPAVTMLGKWGVGGDLVTVAKGAVFARVLHQEVEWPDPIEQSRDREFWTAVWLLLALAHGKIKSLKRSVEHLQEWEGRLLLDVVAFHATSTSRDLYSSQDGTVNVSSIQHLESSFGRRLFALIITRWGISSLTIVICSLGALAHGVMSHVAAGYLFCSGKSYVFF